jgi:hypothetical protein
VLRGDRDRADLEVDLAVAQAEDLAAAQQRQDRDRDDAPDVLGHPRAELVGLVPGKEAGLALLGSRDPDRVDGRVDGLPAFLGRLEDPLEESEGHLGPPGRALGDRENEVFDDGAPDAFDGKVVERREQLEVLVREEDRARPRANAAGRADLVALEPCLRERGESLGRGAW